jgi:hypothetical protein
MPGLDARAEFEKCSGRHSDSCDCALKFCSRYKRVQYWFICCLLTSRAGDNSETSRVWATQTRGEALEIRESRDLHLILHEMVA